MGAPLLVSLWSSQPVFSDLPGLAPFRELANAGKVSFANSAFYGIVGEQQLDAGRETRLAAVRADPCSALFGQLIDARLPVAFFSDFNCPNCRVLEAVLIRYDAENPGIIRIIRHELPLLGAASVIASKAVLAADLQGGYTRMHDRLMRTRMVTDLNLVASIADAEGLDGQRLLADMRAAEIALALENAKDIASVFGFYGTPATVIGRTVFLGAISARDVEQIIDAELALPPVNCGTRDGTARQNEA